MPIFILLIIVNYVFSVIIKKIFIKRSAPGFTARAVVVACVTQFGYLYAFDKLVPHSGVSYVGGGAGDVLVFYVVIVLFLSILSISTIAFIFYSTFSKGARVIYSSVLIALLTAFSFYTLILPRALPQIALYGKIVDQYDQPVASAKVYFAGIRDGKYFGAPIKEVRVSDPKLKGYVSYSTATTDKEGIFHIGGFSKVLTLFNDPFEAKGYTIQFPSKNSSMPYYESVSFTASETYTRNNPYVIHAFKYDPHTEEVMTGYFNSPRMKPDDTIYYLTSSQDGFLLSKTTSKNAYLKISCLSGKHDEKDEKSDWRLTIMPVNGGIQETIDFYTHEAPASGYKDQLIYDMKKNAIDYAPGTGLRKYYFHANNKSIYGAVYFYFSVLNNDSCSFDSKRIKFNKKGNRNLYFGRERFL